MSILSRHNLSSRQFRQTTRFKKEPDLKLKNLRTLDLRRLGRVTSVVGGVVGSTLVGLGWHFDHGDVPTHRINVNEGALVRTITKQPSFMSHAARAKRRFHLRQQQRMKRRRQIRGTRGTGVMRRTRRRYRRPANARTGGYVGREMKFVDSLILGDNFAATWQPMQNVAMGCISAVSQGANESQRIGRRYWIHSIHMKGLVRVPATDVVASPEPDVYIRLALVLDQQANNAVLNGSDVYVNPPGGAVHLDHRNLQFTNRFKVLWERTIVLPTSQSTVNVDDSTISPTFSSGLVQRQVKFNKQFNTPIVVETNGVTAVIGSITTNALHVIGVATNSDAEFSGHFRLRYTG